MWINNQLMIDNKIKAKKAYDAMQIESKLEKVEDSNLLEIPWIWKSTANKLFSAGIKSERQLVKKWLDEVLKIVDNPLSIISIEKYFKSLNKEEWVSEM